MTLSCQAAVWRQQTCRPGAAKPAAAARCLAAGKASSGSSSSRAHSGRPPRHLYCAETGGGNVHCTLFTLNSSRHRWPFRHAHMLVWHSAIVHGCSKQLGVFGVITASRCWLPQSAAAGLLMAGLRSSQLAAAQQGQPTTSSSSSSSVHPRPGELTLAMHRQQRHLQGVAEGRVVVLLAALARRAMPGGGCDRMPAAGTLLSLIQDCGGYLILYCQGRRQLAS